MSDNSFEKKLKDLNLTNEELKRFSDAFKNDEFRKLFMEYAEELNDPKNRELYEQEIRAAEEERGSNVTFVHPNPGHVLKTTIDGNKKCFINIATNENVEKPSYAKSVGTSGQQGVQWSLPHCLAGPHEDIDHDSKPCTIFDVVFSPDTYRMAETNKRFMKMVEDSAIDSLENNFHCKLDRNNMKKLKMKFKGTPKATIIRKKKENQQPEAKKDTEQELKQEADDIIEQAKAKAQNHKVVLSSHNRTVNSPPTTETKQPEIVAPRTDENGFTIPTYRIVHRGEFDMEECTNALVPQVRSMRPKELVVEIDLPLCASSSNVDLDVCERSLKLHCNSPKYSLDLHLPYPVRESDSHARFDKKQRKLLVTLVVIRETSTIVQLSANEDAEEVEADTEDTQENSQEAHLEEQENNAHMEEANEENSTEMIPTITTNEIISAIDRPSNITYSAIPFEYKQGLARVALVLYVKNVDESSVKVDNDGQHVTIQLASLGSGYYPLYHQLCLDFDEPMTIDTSQNSLTITFNDDNVLVLLKKTSNEMKLTQFSSGLTRDDMKVNRFSAETINASSQKQPLCKEDFLAARSDSTSSSSNGDQNKKLTKRQAKKLAKGNRKKQDAVNDNEELADEISKITIQTQRTEKLLNGLHDAGKVDSNENDDDVVDMPKVIPNPTIYRRHLSESHVDLDMMSNGELKLKSILKNSMKHRSYSESLNDPFNAVSVDFQRQDSTFEASSTVEDLTSSNENNSMVTSPESSGSNGFCSTSNSSVNVKHVTFNSQVSRKTFKPGGPVSSMRKLTTNQQRKLKKRKRQDSLNSQSSDQDDSVNEKPCAKVTDTYKNPVEFQDVIAWQASGSQPTDDNDARNVSIDAAPTKTKSAVKFSNSLMFELDN